MTDNELAEAADQRRNDEHEREQEESLALEIARDYARLQGVHAAFQRGDYWHEFSKATEDGRLKSRYWALAALYWEAARYQEHAERKPAA